MQVHRGCLAPGEVGQDGEPSPITILELFCSVRTELGAFLFGHGAALSVLLPVLCPQIPALWCSAIFIPSTLLLLLCCHHSKFVQYLASCSCIPCLLSPSPSAPHGQQSRGSGCTMAHGYFRSYLWFTSNWEVSIPFKLFRNIECTPLPDLLH